jgi:hypothetical protein
LISGFHIVIGKLIEAVCQGCPRIIFWEKAECGMENAKCLEIGLLNGDAKILQTWRCEMKKNLDSLLTDPLALGEFLVEKPCEAPLWP